MERLFRIVLLKILMELKHQGRLRASPPNGRLWWKMHTVTNTLAYRIMIFVIARANFS